MATDTLKKMPPAPGMRVGERIELISMPNEPALGELYRKGNKGTVTGLNQTSAGIQISVDWDNGGKSMLLDGVAQSKIIARKTTGGGE